jgi:hypothetical protein
MIVGVEGYRGEHENKTITLNDGERERERGEK